MTHSVDARVVQVPLQRSEPRNAGHQLIDGGRGILNWLDNAGQAALIVLGDSCLGQSPNSRDIGLRIYAMAAHGFANIGVEQLDGRPRRLSRV